MSKNLQLVREGWGGRNILNAWDHSKVETVEPGVEDYKIAMLFTAAPDLLEAARRLIAYRDSAGPLNFQLEKADDFINELRAAIAKTGGEL